MQDWKEKYPIIITQDVHWGDMDAFQHVNNKIYFRYFEDVRLAYLEAIGSLELMKTSKTGPVLASTSCEYRAPVLFPDTVHIATRTYDLQPKRVSMEYSVFSEQQQKVVAEGTGMMVYFDFKTQRSVEIPEQVVAQMRALQQD
jgi:acyl-CoA thioester hydrolase